MNVHGQTFLKDAVTTLIENYTLIFVLVSITFRLGPFLVQTLEIIHSPPKKGPDTITISSSPQWPKVQLLHPF